MPKKTQNIYKRKDGRWEGRYKKTKDQNGKTKYGYVYGKTYTETKIKLEYAKEHVIKHDSMLYKELVEMWLDCKRLEVKETTYVKYHNLIYTHILPSLGDIPLENLTTDKVVKFIHEKLTDGRVDKQGGLSHKTVKDIIVLMKTTIHYGRLENKKIPCILELIKIPSVEKEVDALNLQEQEQLENYLLNHLDRCHLGILLCLYTGMRIGELCALQEKDIFLNEGIIKVSKTLQRIQNIDIHEKNKTKIIISSPKSKKAIRTIPIPKALMQIIQQHMSDYEDCYFLTGSDQYMEPRILQYKFRKIMQNAQLHDINFHILRHTFATRCIEVGFDIKSLSEILGHSDIKITLNTYTHSSFDLKRENMNKLKLKISTEKEKVLQ